MKNKESVLKHRKLPGPAGLLPKLHEQMNHGERLAKCKLPKKKKDTEIYNLSESCLSPSSSQNQSISSQVEETILLSQLQSDCGPIIWSIIQKYSIQNILKMITCNQLPKELLPTDARAFLKDNSGVLGCTIHRSVIKAYKNSLCCCSLLLLKQVSIFSPTGKKFYANITLSNVVRIYTPENTTNSHIVTVHPRFASPLSISEVEALEADCLKPPTPSSMATAASSSSQLSLSPISKPVCYRIQPQVVMRNNQSTMINVSSEQSIKKCSTISISQYSSGLGSLLKCNSISIASKLPVNCHIPVTDSDQINHHQQQPIDCLTTIKITPPMSINMSTLDDTMNTDLLEDDMDDLLFSMADEIP
ncbi:unnamed protein product [Heterobilharzia americana]|nr:unnamed protein product [Heterobilharzia americana]